MPTEGLINELNSIRNRLREKADRFLEEHPDIHPDQRPSAQNLVHYLAFRSLDVRSLQDQLHAAGLSSMASSESHVMSQLEQILRRLGQAIPPGEASLCTYQQGFRILEDHNQTLFYTDLDPEIPHIMVTMEAAIATDEDKLRTLFRNGMTVARINCAHDTPKDWLRWIETIRHIAMDEQYNCPIYMDLPGPKMRLMLRGEAARKGKLPIAVGDEILFVEPDAQIPDDVSAISCLEQGVLAQLQDGTRVLLDDGKFEGVFVRDADETKLKITRVSGKKHRLKAEKGVNFPEAVLDIPVLTDVDRSIIPFVATHADLIGCSFVRTAKDIRDIQNALTPFPQKPRMILKIETPEAVKHLPELLLEAMKQDAFGVMIARGDLAVEIGFERLSEIQDEILWICEAGHVPVIWATQVLESLMKSGLATRGEVTDAVHAFNAECVMLNKGEFITETIKTLNDILRRTGKHRKKKTYTLRPLQIASAFLQDQHLST